MKKFTIFAKVNNLSVITLTLALAIIIPMNALVDGLPRHTRSLAGNTQAHKAPEDSIGDFLRVRHIAKKMPLVQTLDKNPVGKETDIKGSNSDSQNRQVVSWVNRFLFGLFGQNSNSNYNNNNNNGNYGHSHESDSCEEDHNPYYSSHGYGNSVESYEYDNHYHHHHGPHSKVVAQNSVNAGIPSV